MSLARPQIASLLESVLEIPLPSADVLALSAHFGGTRALLGARRAELVAAGLPPDAARRLVASRRLARFLARRPRSRRILSARCVAARLPHLSWCPIEEVWVVALDGRRRVLTTRLVGRGDVGRCQVSPAEIFGVVLRVRATSFYLVHNHPSGLLAPSHADVVLTDQLRALGRELAVPLDDHVIVAADRYESLVDRKRGPIGVAPGRRRVSP